MELYHNSQYLTLVLLSLFILFMILLSSKVNIIKLNKERKHMDQL